MHAWWWLTLSLSSPHMGLVFLDACWNMSTSLPDVYFSSLARNATHQVYQWSLICPCGCGALHEVFWQRCRGPWCLLVWECAGSCVMPGRCRGGWWCCCLLGLWCYVVLVVEWRFFVILYPLCWVPAWHVQVLVVDSGHCWCFRLIILECLGQMIGLMVDGTI